MDATPVMVEDAKRMLDAPKGLATSQRNDVIQSDLELVHRCLAGDPGAWDTLYSSYHNGLTFSVKLLLGPGDCDPNLRDEIVARVWYVLVKDQGRALGRFNADRGCRLSTFLGQIARSEASNFFRAERRRRRRERIAAKCEAEVKILTPNQLLGQIRAFTGTLTPREKDFVAGFLLGEEQADNEFSQSNRWQLSRRVREKLHKYCGSS